MNVNKTFVLISTIILFMFFNKFLKIIKMYGGNYYSVRYKVIGNVSYFDTYKKTKVLSCNRFNIYFVFIKSVIFK